MLMRQINFVEKSERELAHNDSRFDKVELEVDESTDVQNENYISH